LEEIVNDRQRLLVRLLKLLDLALVVLAFALSIFFVVKEEQRSSLESFLSMRTRISNFGIFVLALFIFHLVFRVFGLYRSRRLSNRRAELLDILRATTVCTASFVVLGWFFSIKMMSVPFLVMFWSLSTLILSAARMTIRSVATRLRIQGKNLRHMLILGTNPRAVEFAHRISTRVDRGYRFLGFVDDDWPGFPDLTGTGFKVVCDYVGLAEYLRRNVVDEVAVYLPLGSFYKHSSEVALLCEQHGIIMRFNSDIFGSKNTRWRAEEFDGDQYVATYTLHRELWPYAIKRTLDVAVAACALLLFAPILAIAAIGIKLTSPGPVFFLQERIGMSKRRFKIFKFRTMVPDAEKLMSALEKDNEAGGPVFKMKNDPRVTRFGRALRKSSIDELPQLFNVLRGDMSLVGPRPLPVRDYEGFSEDWQRRRFSVKPGITCLWQVNGRSGITFDQWMLLDLQYMDEWSLWLDLKILAKTVPAVIKGEGAA
jgi:exopolysaccharide biosynthesis polyprenyl glycosylphosphotransferase